MTPNLPNFDLASFATSVTATHLLFDGEGWIEARRKWLTFPHPEVDGVEDGWGWEFKSGGDAARWLRSAL